MKKHFSKILIFCLTAILSMGVLAGCGGNRFDPGVVNFWVYGTTEQLAMYNKLVETFNKTYAADQDYEVKMTTKPNGTYGSAILYTANSDSGPDVILQTDADFKKYAVMGFFSDIQSELDAVTDIDISDIMPSVTQRFKYNLETNTSNETDPYFALPLEAQPAALYYNEDILLEAGIIIISVDEEDLGT